MWLLDRLLRALIKTGCLVITDFDGKEYSYGSGADAPVRIRFTKKSTAWRIASDPRLGAGEAYMDGELVVEPPHDIRDMVLLVMGNAGRTGGGMAPPSPLRRLADSLVARFDDINHRARAVRQPA